MESLFPCRGQREPHKGQRRQESRSEDSDETILSSGKTLGEAVTEKGVPGRTKPHASSWSMCYLCMGSGLTCPFSVKGLLDSLLLTVSTDQPRLLCQKAMT